ncbi:diacylglycerol kinase family protein [Oricola sp.]|uniref:diacylglycerol/lipid kinase family protein n=1 Tax=Oricola sp. TaxID=1979950 RepID=UPI003518C487
MRFAAVINSQASTLKTADLDRLANRLVERFSAAGHAIDIAFTEGDGMDKSIRDAVESGEADAVLAGGGDGTISMAAGIVQGTSKALAILPGGNMNLFARSLGIPLDLDAAIEALASGHPHKVDIAFANKRPFIHEFSLGLHPEMIEMRDQQKFGSRLGKIVGGIRSLSRAILRPPRVRVWLEDADGERRPLVTSALAVSNNLFGDGHLPYADRVDGGELGVYIAHTSTSAELAAIAARIPAGSWSSLPQMEVFTATQLKLARRGRLKAAIDGEMVRMDSPVEVRIAPGVLTVIVPNEDHAVRGQ